MKILVCMKQVPQKDAPLKLNESGTWIREDVSYEVNEPDAYALEEALRQKEKHGGEVVVITSGPARDLDQVYFSARRENEERLRSHTDNSPMAVVEWNADLNITRWTGAAEKMFGWSAEEAIGKPITELPGICEEDLPIVQSVIRQLADGVQAVQRERRRELTLEGHREEVRHGATVPGQAAGARPAPRSSTPSVPQISWTSSTTVSQMTSIFGFFSVRSSMIFEARNSWRR